MKAPFLILLLALLSMGLWERRIVAGLRDEAAALQAEQVAAAQLAEDIAARKRELPAAAGAQPVAELDRNELLRLRNAVRQLRATQGDLVALHAENKRLADELNSGAAQPSRAADSAGYIPRAHWMNAGNATPEAALQTAFLAMRDGNLDLLLTLLGEKESEAVRLQLGTDPDKTRAEFTRDLREHFTGTGFQIVGREEIPGGRVRLKVKFDPASEPMDAEFYKVGEVWKMGALPLR